MNDRTIWLVMSAAALWCALAAPMAHAQTFRDDTGYNALEAKLGAGIPNGAGIRVTLVEASTDNDVDEDKFPNDGEYDYIPNTSSAQMIGKQFTIRIPPGTTGADVSSHANSSANPFFGNNSIGFGVTEAELFYAGHWLGEGQLRTTEGIDPDFTLHTNSSKTSRIASHSWVGAINQEDDPETEFDESTLMDVDLTLEAVQRVEWLIDRDNYIQVAGRSANSPLNAGAFNAIGVASITNTGTGSATVALGGAYTAGRADGEIVGYASAVSSATPQVAAVTLLLIQFAHDNPALSNGFELNRNGETIYHGESAEVIKAVLMAGANRHIVTAWPNGHTYTINTSNGLNQRFGSGLVNIWDSYHILAAGERDSVEDGGTHFGRRGFDYDPSFGGANGSNAVATYQFTAAADIRELRAALTWHIQIDIDLVNASDVHNAAVLYNLDLALYEVTGSGDVLVASSASTNENSENIWLTGLGAGTYKFVVTPGPGQGAFEWDYGFAWTASVPEPSSLAVLAVVVAASASRRRQRVTARRARD